jgi:hypothetical protein
MTEGKDENLMTKLESLGEDEVRRRLANGVFGPRKKNRVEAWLETKATERLRQRDEQEQRHRGEELATAKSSAVATWASSIVAGLSLVVAVIAFVESRRALSASEA